MIKVFISYSRQDSKFVDRLEQDLKNAGFDSVWRDTSNLIGSQNWRSDLQVALDQSDVLILVVSPHSLASEEVTAEYNEFLENKKPIVPVILKNAELKGRLRLIQKIPFEGRDYSVAFNELLLSIRSAVSKKADQVVVDKATIGSSGESVESMQLQFTKRMLLFLLVVLIPTFILSIASLIRPNTETPQPTLTSTIPSEPTLVNEIEPSISPTPVPTSVDQFVYSAEGRIYYQERGGENRSWIISGNVSNARHPRFSPDGTRVAFIGSDFNGVDQIFVTTTEENARPEQRAGTEDAKNCLSWIDEDSFEITTPMESGFAIRFINFGNRTERPSERFPYGVYESCYTYPTGENSYVVYSRREDSDAEIYLRDLETGLEYAVTNNNVDDLMPNIGGIDKFAYYREIAGSDPVTYELIEQGASALFGHVAEELPFPIPDIDGLFDTSRLSRIVWGGSAGGEAIALGFERPDRSQIGLGIYRDIVSNGLGPHLLIGAPDSATDPDWRQRRQ